jgi:hypothetical protein
MRYGLRFAGSMADAALGLGVIPGAFGATAIATVA